MQFNILIIIIADSSAFCSFYYYFSQSLMQIEKNVLFNMHIISDSFGFKTPNPKIHYVSSFYYYFSQSLMQT